MPDTSGSGQALLDAIASHTGGWAEGAVAFVGGVIWYLWSKATKAGDEDRDKPSNMSIGGTGVAYLADGNPIRELLAEVKGLRGDLAEARSEDEARRHENEREIASDLKRENRMLNERLGVLQTGQTRTHDNQDEIVKRLRQLLGEADEAEAARGRRS